MSKEQMQQVSFEELWSVLSGSTKFGRDELVEMLAVQDDDSKDFCLYHRQKAFCVPLDKIREYFITHAKPIPPMTKDQELVYLREKVKKMQVEAEAFQAGEKVARPAPNVPDEPEVLDVKIDPEAPIHDAGADTVINTADPLPPKRDESIPPPQDRTKMSLKDTRAMLAKELKDTKTPNKKVTDGAQPKDVKDREGIVDNLLKKK